MNELLKKYFGYDEFRPGQREIIQKVMEHEDVLEVGNRCAISCQR